jgi:hypothetical protein
MASRMEMRQASIAVAKFVAGSMANSAMSVRAVLCNMIAAT